MSVIRVEPSSLPSWAREIATLLPASSNFVLSGNTQDVFLVSADDPSGNPEFLKLTDVLHKALSSRGIERTLLFEAGWPARAIPIEARTELEAVIDRSLDELGRGDSLNGLIGLIERQGQLTEPLGLIILGASRLVRKATELNDDEFRFFRRVESIIRRSRPIKVGDDVERLIYNPVIWVLDNERDIPDWFLLNNELVRQVVLPLPDAGDRLVAARRAVGHMLTEQEGDDVAYAATVLARQTAGLSLTALRRIVDIAGDQGIEARQFEDAARSYRVGVTDNPWRRSYVRDRILSEIDQPPGYFSLKDRVLGQDSAVNRSLDILIRSASGLTAAHASPSATRPRGVLFLAGPTGVGKTELAKGLTKLLFDDERAYIRFDMSEFTAEHAADRLIGSPPGYVGYDAGGELTNAIRQRPFSLVLFDEVEKAHPRILDKFLQLLDDGRLTDGRGETVFFTEAVVVFTSNLGIYVEHDVSDEHGNIRKVRELNVQPPTSDQERAEMARRVESAIRDYFTWQLGRPELLNRIGNNIVVFDFIDRATGARILDSMVGNVLTRIGTEQALQLELSDPAKSQLVGACLKDSVLELGGRGIGSLVETVLVNPLSNALFTGRHQLGNRAVLDSLVEHGGTWRAQLIPA